ncbi:hypothetical protein M758_12G154100 [Ceratodon purpureus]|nr:hypothetical protein M758_12G154100 [Ceratodon purpureus]
MAERGSGKLLGVSDWEQLFQDFRASLDLQQKWLASWPGLTIVDQALQSITKREFPLKAPLFNFLEENGCALLGDDDAPAGMAMLVDSLKVVLHAPVDGVAITYGLKEQMLVMVTTVAIDVDAIHTATAPLEALTETLLGFISRTNYAVDRHVRATACECLKALEMAHPCLLNLCVGHVFSFCQSERTHASQAYKLLLTAILHNMACHMYTGKSRQAGANSFLSITLPLVPFSVPSYLAASNARQEAAAVPARELSAGSVKEFKRAVAYLLQHLDLLTEFGMLEFVTRFLNIAKALDLHGSLLRPTVSSHLYVYNPVMIHVVLVIITQFAKAFEGVEHVTVKRLATLCRESQQPLPIRLLGLHWLLGLEKQLKLETSIIESQAPGLYPRMYDPLALQALKLETLAQCAAQLASLEATGFDGHSSQSSMGIFKVLNMGVAPADTASQILNQGLLCLSSFTWLPPSSTETRIAFFVLHSFLTAAVPHKGSSPDADIGTFTKSPLFCTIQLILVKMALKILTLIPCILKLLDQLLACETHHSLGEHLLRTFNDDLLPQLAPNRNLPAYFPLLERIAENKNIPPARLLELLTLYIRKRVEEEKGDRGLRLWQRGNQVLGICCKVLMHHQSSRGFHGLVQLLTFMCRFFPDLDCRDTARLYLRMLISIPGEPLRKILRHGDKGIEEANASQYNTVSSHLSKQATQLEVPEYVKLTRESTLLVRHSWSLVLYNTFQTGVSGGYTDLSVRVPEVIVEEVSDQPKDANDEVKNRSLQVTTNEKGALIVQESETKAKEKKGRPTDTVPRVMDAKTATILGVLRQHFEEIPDYRNGFGVKITVRCKLSFLGEALQRLQAESDSSSNSANESGSWPAIYAVVLSFITTGLYGPIPSVHVPFLLSEPPQKSSWRTPGIDSPTSVITDADQQFNRGKYKDKKKAFPDQDSDDDRDHEILLLEGSKDDSSIVNSETILVELEPKQPVPTLVDAHIVFSNEDGHTVQGQLDSIPVGIEDLFQKPLLPQDLPLSDQPEYLFSLFKALFEACSGPGHLGGETFPLKNSESQPGVSIEGSESVKLLEGQADRIVGAVEQWLGPFVVAVSGSSLTGMVKDGGVLKHPVFPEEEFTFHPGGESGRSSYGWPGPVQLRLEDSMSNRGEQSSSNVNLRAMGTEVSSKGGLGCFFVLIFLPPRYHLLLRMEVSDWSTLVRIRTDHWPCLAHVDEFLEALVMSR